MGLEAVGSMVNDIGGAYGILCSEMIGDSRANPPEEAKGSAVSWMRVIIRQD